MSVPVLIISCIVPRQPVKQITILGVNFFVSRFKSLVIKIVIRIISGSIFFINPIRLLGLTNAMLADAIAFNVVQGITDFECKDLVSKVLMKQVSERKTVGFLERLPEKNPKIFIKNNENVELYFPSLS